MAFHRLGLSRKTRCLGVGHPLPFSPVPILTLVNYPSLRYHYGQLRQERLLNSLSDLLSGVRTHGFKPISVEPHVKDGGVFVFFEYTPSESEDILSNIQSDLRNYIQSQGGVPSSAGLRRGTIWVVQGQPWREVQLSFRFNAVQSFNGIQDMNRFASPLLRVMFNGTDPEEESLYHTFRVYTLSLPAIAFHSFPHQPFGRIVDISAPTPIPGTSYHASTVTFSKLRSSIVARNVVHGLHIDKTRLHTAFLPPVQAHVIRDWATKHPRIVIPVVVFFLGTLTYAVSHVPLRVTSPPTFVRFLIQYGHLWLRERSLTGLTIEVLFRFLDVPMSNSILFAESRLYQWLRRNTIDRLNFKHADALDADAEAAWHERQDVETALKNYLDDMPSMSFIILNIVFPCQLTPTANIAFLYGPQGSGKSKMLSRILQDKKRYD